jgi:hypothetical protein
MVEPEPIYSDAWVRQFEGEAMPLLGARNAQADFSSHVRFPGAGSAARWMPALRHLSPTDVADVWAWLHAIAKLPLQPYQP